MTEMTGGRAVLEMLKAYGARHSFGILGFQGITFHDAIYQQEEPVFQHVLVRDEKHGAFMAECYGRIAGRPGICDATVGPGVTNLVSGLAEAFHASTPMLAITSDVNTAMATRNVTQETDQVAILKPVVKWSTRVEHVERIPELMHRAFAMANSGRPGPVHVDIPEDVFHGKVDFSGDDFRPMPDMAACPALRTRPDQRAVDRAAQLLRSAERPVILAGGGVVISRAWDELLALAESLDIPVATTLTGKGSIDERHALSIGLAGRFTKFANQFVQRADVILVVGCKLGEIATSRWTLVPSSARLIHVDVDPSIIGRVYRTEVGLCGDAQLALQDLLAATSETKSKGDPETRTAIAEARQQWEDSVAARTQSDEVPINQARLMREIRRAVPDESILVVDGGFATHWSGIYFDVHLPGHSYIANRGQAAIGYGFPAAIGAKLAAPSRPVFALVGDGGFGMSLIELETALRAGAPVVTIVANNRAMGYVKALQHSIFGHRYISSDLLDLDYGQISRDFGCYGARVEDPNDIGNAIRDAMESGKPAVLDVLVTTDPAKMLPAADPRAAAAKQD